MKRLLIGLTALFLLTAGAVGETRLMVVSDIHYLDASLREEGEFFLRVLRGGDGKLTQEGDILLDALQAEVIRLRPDALLVTGDLTFNGERASHLTLAKRFQAIEAAGVPVWVMPGNHDINSPDPRGYGAGGWYYVRGVTPEEFAGIYAEFMGPAGEGANLSFAVDVGEDLRVLMTDVCFYRDIGQTFGLFLAGHGRWLEAALKSAREAGRRVITASHHSLLAHTQFMRDSYVMLGGEDMAAIDRRYGVRLHLSGHLHAQHITCEDGLYDAALGAFCSSPHRYALVTLEDDGTLTYEARALDDDCLPAGFQALSRQWYLDISREKTRAALRDTNLSEAELDAMADFSARFSLAYFSGTFQSDDGTWREDPGYALWKAQANSPYWQYMSMVMDEAAGDNLHLQLRD